MANIAMIGTGYWGKNLVRTFHALGALRAICDTDRDAAEALAAHYQVEHLSWEAVLARHDLSAVAIATPAASHAALIKAALLAGKHVFVEKPLALQLADAEEVVNLAKELSLTLMVGHLMQYHAGFLKLKTCIQNGDLGRLQYIYSNRLNLGKIRREEDILWSFAPHDISMILGLTGQIPTEVTATGSYHLHQSIADVTTTHLKFAGGEQAHIFVSWLHPFKEQKLVVIGEKGMAVLDDVEPWDRKLIFYPHQINWKNGEPIPHKENGIALSLEPAEPLLTECKHFIDCVEQGMRPITDGTEGLRVLQVLTQASAALKQNRAPNLIEKSALDYFVHPTAIVDTPSTIGEHTKIWHFSHVLAGSTIGPHCVIGQNVSIGPDVTVGAHCKIQNNVSLYKGVTLEEGVFCGPSCVFTNVLTPRAQINRQNEFLPTHVGKGATIGANATIVCGVNLGKYCLIGAGAVITKDVPAHALMVGNPAKQIGWVSHAGERLGADLICPREGRAYQITKEGQLEIIEETSDEITNMV